MKFNVEGKLFQQQLQAVNKVINAKSTITMLNNFLLCVEGDRLSITGNDSENSLTAYLPITESEGDGSIAISARRLLEITKEIDNQPLTFYVNDETKEVDLRFLNGHFNFMGVDGNDYPQRREPGDEKVEMFLPASMVMKGIENTWYAVSTDTTRPVMTGILWDIHPEDITFVSSDTHKLVKYVNREKAPGVESSFILPSKTANILRSLISSEDAEVKITYDSKGGVFEFGDYVLSSVFILGRYPNYARVIPENNPFALVVDRASLATALRRVTLFSPKSSNLVVLNLQPNEILLSAQDLDYGMSAEERVSCEYEGNTMKLGFNGAFMIEILANIHDENVMIRLTDPARPGLYSPLKEKDGEELVIIQMPMQTI
ncbi:MAG: DNA polymerase III subunit beta [Candidatus Amulumruptor caecigallinarius]|nr:DNA polymerase III subunit beta [Candidatus Amulumruptor caecigallinarius]